MMRAQVMATAAATAAACALLIGLPDNVTGAASVAPWVPSCPLEDSPGPCYWDAGAAGNGMGASFVRLGDGRIVYL